MKPFLPIVVLVCSTVCSTLLGAASHAQNVPAQSAPAHSMPTTADANATKAKAIIQQAIKALGGDAWLNIRDHEEQGRLYGLRSGRPSFYTRIPEHSGVPFWSFSEFPDKERIEFTKERDAAEVMVGDKGYEVNFKGAYPMDAGDLVDYQRRHHFALDLVLRTWVNDPTVITLYEGNAIAAQHPSEKVTLVNSKNEAVSLFFDVYSHLPVKKAFEWRDPVDKQKNLEEEVYDNYKPIAGGVMWPMNITRFYNGEIASERFFNTVTINQGPDPAMFDPHSGYDPNKPVKKH